jgi:molecular chaperone GrpE
MTENKDKNMENGTAEELNTPQQETAKNSQTENTDKKAEEKDDQENAEEQQNEKEEEKDPLEAAQEQISKLKDQYLRSVAEFDNYRKRTMKEKAELILNGGEKTITAVLPVLDDFERALADNNDDPQAIKKGMELIFKKFQKTLEGLGVKKIDTQDKDFDTDQMEAIAMVPGMGDDKKGKVIDCVQTGYTLNDKVIRHAKVAVGQ